MVDRTGDSSRAQETKQAAPHRWIALAARAPRAARSLRACRVAVAWAAVDLLRRRRARPNILSACSRTPSA
eukprot:15142908-Alexandrium_andersonii.AAC.1